MGDLVVVQRELLGYEQEFKSVLAAPTINFQREVEFALQILESNDYTAKVALQKPASLRNSVINVAALGVSLNPAKKQAYLVPRKTGITLVVSWMGLIDLAVECGAILWAKAEVVHEQDELQIVGYDKPPVHVRNPFAKNRGEIVGAYCVAKLASGDYLTEVMSIEELHAVRDRSEAWQNGQKGPWKTDKAEMCKKSVVRRASKSWPRTTASDDRISRVIEHMDRDEDERVNFENEGAQPRVDCDAYIKEAQATTTREKLQEVYTRAMTALNEARDRAGMDRFKAAAYEHRAAIDRADAERRASANNDVIDA